MRINITDDFRQSLRLWMETDNLTYIEAGKVIGVSHVTIGNWLKDSPSINSKYYSILEPYISKYRSLKEQREELKPLADQAQNQNCYITIDTITPLINYKKKNNLSYEQMAEKFEIPITFLVNLLESKEDKKILIDGENVLLFITMTSKIIHEQNEKTV